MNARTLSVALFAILLISVPTLASDARAFYSGLDSVRLRATVNVTITRPLYEGHKAPIQGEGFIEYREQDGRFRTTVWVDPKLGLVANMEVAYDGENYQVHFLDDGALSVDQPQFQLGEFLSVPTSIPNPFYLPLPYLGPDDDACPGCQLTLPFVQKTDAWSKLSMDSEIGEAVGGARGGVPYDYRVHAIAASSEQVASLEHVERIDRVGLAGDVQQSSVFSDFEDGFPRVIRVLGYEPNHEDPVMTIEYAVEELVLNSKLLDSVFTITPGSATTIFENGSVTPPNSSD